MLRYMYNTCDTEVFFYDDEIDKAKDYYSNSAMCDRKEANDIEACESIEQLVDVLNRYHAGDSIGEWKVKVIKR